MFRSALCLAALLLCGSAARAAVLSCPGNEAIVGVTGTLIPQLSTDNAALITSIAIDCARSGLRKLFDAAGTSRTGRPRRQLYSQPPQLGPARVSLPLSV